MACFDRHTGLPYPRFTPKPRPKCGQLHHMPAQRILSGHDNRGRQRWVCKDCLRLIGYNDPPSNKPPQLELDE